jgi:hypothetical protein
MARIVKDYGYTLAELRKLSDDDHMSITLRAEFFVDDEVNTWHWSKGHEMRDARMRCAYSGGDQAGAAFRRHAATAAHRGRPHPR